MSIAIENSFPYSDGLILSKDKFMSYSYYASKAMNRFNLRQALILPSDIGRIYGDTQIEFGSQNEIWKTSKRIFRAYNEDIGEGV